MNKFSIHTHISLNYSFVVPNYLESLQAPHGMAAKRYQNSGDAANRTSLREPLRFHFSKQTMNSRIFKASMGETLATWDFANIETCGIPTQEIKELYRR